jgi:Leu/Phe-tRNA-protein transferase
MISKGLYFLQHEKKHKMAWIHVDDGVVMASSFELQQSLEKNLKDNMLKIHWSHNLALVVGISLSRTNKDFILSPMQ